MASSRLYLGYSEFIRILSVARAALKTNINLNEVRKRTPHNQNAIKTI